ncbi:IS1380 family transposase, partial [Aquisphaera insulae]|uniref:IS1380 family transposase n=1 Tax=Aquisphaera insulae TaxID=2712864 RepID=UPI0013EC07D1
MKPTVHEKLRRCKRRIEKRLENHPEEGRESPMFTATDVHYDLSSRARGIACGGIGALMMVARASGLIGDIDSRLKLLKRHLPYHESDHVLNIALNIAAGGSRIEHIELRRNDEAFLDAIGAGRIPDPTTEGDFCRRFEEPDVLDLMDAFNAARLRVWRRQPAGFFERAVIDVDGTLVGTGAECKAGIDIAYDGTWGYHPLVVSLANTSEPLYLANRPANRPSHDGAWVYEEKAIALCRKAGFREILLRGDTDFSQTTRLDRWDDTGYIRFIFGLDAMPNLVELADALPEGAYGYLERPELPIKAVPRERPERHKAKVVEAREFETIGTLEEMVAEFDYRPTACDRSYRVVVLRKLLATDKGQIRLFEKYRYFFYITNDRESPAEGIVLTANGRCNQENLVAQLKGGVHALATPVDDLVSNWAYMVMASLAWSLKAWSALLLPVSPRHAERHEAQRRALLGMEFRTYRAAMIE